MRATRPPRPMCCSWRPWSSPTCSFGWATVTPITGDERRRDNDRGRGGQPAEALAVAIPAEPVASGADPDHVRAAGPAPVDAGHVARDRGRNAPFPTGACPPVPAVAQLCRRVAGGSVRILLGQQPPR